MGLQVFLTNILKFLDKTILPFLLAIATLVFLWNAARYFIIGGGNEEDQTKAKSHALWGILAFVIIISFWGIVNMFVKGIGVNNTQAPTPDYMRDKTSSGAPDDWGTGSSRTNVVPTGPAECTVYSSDGTCAGRENQ